MPQVRWHRVFAVLLCLSAAIALAQNYPAPYPRDNASKVFENDRVIVWDVHWPKGQPTAMHQHPFDQLSVTLTGGSVRVTRLGGTPVVNQSAIGSVTLTPHGTIHMEEGLSEIPQHKIMLELKPPATPSLSAEGVPGAFPQTGAIKLLENDRLIAWDFAWKPGQPVPRHADDLSSVTVYLDGGTMHSIPEQGAAKDTTRHAGEVVFSPHGRGAHTDEAVAAPVRAIVVELK